MRKCKARYKLGEQGFGMKRAHLGPHTFRTEAAAARELRRQFRRGWGKVKMFVSYDCGKTWDWKR